MYIRNINLCVTLRLNHTHAQQVYTVFQVLGDRESSPAYQP